MRVSRVPMFGVFSNGLIAVITSKRFKLLILSILERYVSTTDNKIDDQLVAAVRTALLPDRV